MTSIIPIADLTAAADAMEARARVSAAGYAIAADHPGVGEVWGIMAETAALIIQHAEKRAVLVPVEEADRLMASLPDAAEMEAGARAHAGDPTMTDAGLTEVVDHAVAVIDVAQERLTRWAIQHRLNAWIDATERLALIGKPMAAGTHERSEARH